MENEIQEPLSSLCPCMAAPQIIVLILNLIILIHIWKAKFGQNIFGVGHGCAPYHDILLALAVLV